MSPLVAFLLLWGFTLGPAIKAATMFSTQPSLWVEPKSLLEPWSNLSLTCYAQLWSPNFQLLKDGVLHEQVYTLIPSMKYQFWLGEMTKDKWGLYRCRSGLDSTVRWSEMSNLVELTGTEPMPKPLLSASPVAWITPGLNTVLRCQTPLRGVTFLLKKEGDDGFLEVAEAGQDGEASFRVRSPGNYSCSYRTHEAGKPSEHATVTIAEYATPPAPVLEFSWSHPEILKPVAPMAVVCVAPLGSLNFQLRCKGEELKVPMSTTSPDFVRFDLNLKELGGRGPLTCRYRISGSQEAVWSSDSKPLELMWSDGTLPAPELTVEPTGPRIEPGSLVRLRCTAPRAGLRFALQREDQNRPHLLQLQKPSGTEATFELHNVCVADSANYSCVYMDLAPPFSGSLTSAPVELRVDGPPPRPTLRALWTGSVKAGRDAILRCESHLRDVSFQLLREGKEVPFTRSSSADLVLTFVGPEQSGNYSCRYMSHQLGAFQSELSDPVELLVKGN